MKIILSRKGFDSKFGGYPSPIFPDATLLSLPILGKNVSKERFNGSKFERYQLLQYKDIRVPTVVKEQLQKLDIKIENYEDLLLNLFKNSKKEKINEIKGLVNNNKCFCHLDPDLINYSVNNRKENWRALFGTKPEDQIHLNDINEKDLFLFFGWYRRVIVDNGSIRFASASRDRDKFNCRIYNNGRHIIFGYLQVDKIINKECKEKIEDWMLDHPHFNKNLWLRKHNTIYVAKKDLVLDDQKTNYPGAGVFKYHDDLVLTETNKETNQELIDKKNNSNPNLNKAFWRKDLFPYGSCTIKHKGKEYNEKNSKWKNKGCFYWEGHGQEFIILDCEAFENHVKNNILEGLIRKKHILIE